MLIVNYLYGYVFAMKEGQIVHFRAERRTKKKGRLRGCVIIEGREIDGCTLKPENLDVHFSQDAIERILKSSRRLTFTGNDTALAEVIEIKYDNPDNPVGDSHILRLLEDQSRGSINPDLYMPPGIDELVEPSESNEPDEPDEQSTTDGTPQESDQTGSDSFTLYTNNRNDLVTDGI